MIQHIKIGFFTLSLFLIFGFKEGHSVQSQQGRGVIKQATKQCERDVANYCVSHLCPQYCDTINSGRNNNEQRLSQCKKECTLENRCRLQPLSNNIPHIAEFEAQLRDQLMQCIAEVRDPEGTKSGRRMTSWKEVETPSWKKLMKH